MSFLLADRFIVYTINVGVEFDPDKNAANIAKHGVSLAAGALLEVRAIVVDDRADYGENRFNAFGLIVGFTYCLTFTWRGTKGQGHQPPQSAP